MKYIVSIGYKRFEFSVDQTAMSFAQLAIAHSVEDESVEIEIKKDEVKEDD